MKTRLLITLAIGAAVLAGPARAADLPPPVQLKGAAPLVPCTWCGFYVGLNGGFASDRANITLTPNPEWFLVDPANAAFLASNGSPSFNKGSATGGVQIGVNSQWWYVVVGLEGDIQYIGVNFSRTTIPLSGANAPLPVAPNTPEIFNFSESLKDQWLATVRIRLGATIGPVLLYWTGGLAFADHEFAQSYTIQNFPSNCSAPCSLTVAAAGSVSRVAAGFAVGGGLEWRIIAPLSVKFEYLFADLGKADFDTTLQHPNEAFSAHHESKVTASLFRAGLNWRFWWPEPRPVIASY